MLQLKVIALIKQDHYVLRSYPLVYDTYIYCMGIVSLPYKKRSEEISN